MIKMKRVLLLKDVNASEATKSFFDKNVLPAFEKVECECFYLEIEIPSPSDEEALGNLITFAKENECESVITIEYYPTISLMCGALKIKYASWVIEGYRAVYWDYSIRNPWNYIFSPNMTLVKEYKEQGLENVFYLPFAPDDGILQNNIEFEKVKIKSV